MSSQKTENLGLHKWSGSDYVLRTEFNENFEDIDGEVTKVASQSEDGRMSSTDKQKLDGIENGAEVNKVDSVNGKTGVINISASDVGAPSDIEFDEHKAKSVTFTTSNREPNESDDNTKGFKKGDVWIFDDGQYIRKSFVCLLENSNGAIWERYAERDDTPIPGPSTLIRGNEDAGYYGTLPASDFITGDELVNLVGLSAGTSQHSNVDWLKFSSGGKLAYSPMKPIRYNLSWDDINNANAVYGEKIVTVKGLQFKVRLWRGAENDPSDYEDNDRDAIGSEWNKLMLPIHENAPSNWEYPEYGGTTEDWGIGFTDADLITHHNHGNGSRTWCQETRGDNTGYRVYRGDLGVSLSGSYPSSYTDSYYGWRPVLELVE